MDRLRSIQEYARARPSGASHSVFPRAVHRAGAGGHMPVDEARGVALLEQGAAMKHSKSQWALGYALCTGERIPQAGALPLASPLPLPRPLGCDAGD